MSDQQNRSDTKEAERFIGVLHSKMQYTKTDRKDTVTGFVYSSSSSSFFFSVICLPTELLGGR